MIDWPLLLAALIAVESGGDVNAVGDGGKAVGCLQIRPIMVKECNRILYRRFGPQDHGGFQFTLEHRKWESTSRNMAITYLRHWGNALRHNKGEEPTYEFYARIWNGGPQGYAKASSEPYWRKVKAEIDRIANESKQ